MCSYRGIWRLFQIFHQIWPTQLQPSTLMMSRCAMFCILLNVSCSISIILHDTCTVLLFLWLLLQMEVFKTSLWILNCTPPLFSPPPHTCTHCSPYPRNHIRPPVPQSFIMFYSGNPFESRITEKCSLLQTVLHLGPFWIQCSPKSPLDCLHLLLCFVLRSCMTVCTIIIIYCI